MPRAALRESASRDRARGDDDDCAWIPRQFFPVASCLERRRGTGEPPPTGLTPTTSGLVRGVVVRWTEDDVGRREEERSVPVLPPHAVVRMRWRTDDLEDLTGARCVTDPVPRNFHDPSGL